MSSPFGVVKRAAGRAGVIGDRIQHVDVALIRGVEDAALEVQFGERGDDAALHADRLVARRNLELIRERQHPVARLCRRGFGGGDHIEKRQVVDLVDLDEREIESRLDDHDVSNRSPAVKQMHSQLWGIEQMAGGRQGKAVGRDRNGRAVGGQAAQSAAPKILTTF